MRQRPRSNDTPALSERHLNPRQFVRGEVNQDRVAVNRQVDNHLALAGTISTVGLLLDELGQTTAALRYHQEALAIFATAPVIDAAELHAGLDTSIAQDLRDPCQATGQ